MWRVLCITMLLQSALAARSQGQWPRSGSGNDEIYFPGAVSPGRRGSERTTTSTPTSATAAVTTRVDQPPTPAMPTEEETAVSSDERPLDQLEKIPLDVIQRLNSIDNLRDFEEEFLSLIGNRNKDDERSSKIETPRPAKCEPEMTTVQLQIPNNSFSILFPSCTRVNRCGGCCNSDLLSCQPVASHERFFQVYVSDYSTGRLLFNKKDIVTVEEHTKCKCDCKIKPEHCNVFQEYYQKDCRCRCINHEDRKKCEQDNSTKIWNYDSCMCRCRDVSSCSTGFFFDEQTCSCKAEPVLLTRFGNSTTAWRRNPLTTRYGHVQTANRRTRLPEDQYNTKN